MNILVRELREVDLEGADRIFRLAFGTFNGLANPLEYGGDLDKVRSRWRADPAGAFAAEVDGELVGSNFLTQWGRVGYFGPLTVHPDFWDRGVGQKLLEPVPGWFEARGCRHTGLYTYSCSPKHLGLYQKLGFWPRQLTAIMSRPVPAAAPAAGVSYYSQVPERARPGLVAAAGRLTDAIYAGLEVGREIRVLLEQKIGDTVFIEDGTGLAGFAAVHCGAGSEAGSNAAFVKFGAARPGPGAKKDFDRLLTACEGLAAARGAARLIAGVSLARRPTYELMRQRGFVIDIVGVNMHRPDEAGYHRPEAWVMDDWR